MKGCCSLSNTRITCFSCGEMNGDTITSPLTEDRDIDLAEDRWDFGMAAGYGLTEFLSEDGVRLVTRDDIDMAVMEDGSCLVVILRGRNLPDSC